MSEIEIEPRRISMKPNHESAKMGRAGANGTKRPSLFRRSASRRSALWPRSWPHGQAVLFSLPSASSRRCAAAWACALLDRATRCLSAGAGGATPGGRAACSRSTTRCGSASSRWSSGRGSTGWCCYSSCSTAWGWRCGTRLRWRRRRGSCRRSGSSRSRSRSRGLQDGGYGTVL